MKKYVVLLMSFLLFGCKPKPIEPVSSFIYPDTIYLRGISGTPSTLSWHLGGGYPYCGWECVVDYSLYTHIKPDYYEVYWGENKSNMVKYKTLSNGEILSFEDVLPMNKSFFLQLKAFYTTKSLIVSSNIIQISSDKIPQAQLINDTFDKNASYDLNGDVFRYEWSYSLSRTTNIKAIVIGKNAKNEYGTWYYDLATGKQIWLWKNFTRGIQWLADGSKAILGKSLDPKPYTEIYIFNTTDFSVKLFSDPNMTIQATSWLPNGKTVAYIETDTLNRYPNHFSVLTKNIETNTIKTLVTFNNTSSENSIYLNGLKYLDDKLLFQKTTFYSKNGTTMSNGEINSVSISNGSLKRELDFEESDWQELSLNHNPSSSKIAFNSRRSGYEAVWVKNLVTKRTYQVFSAASCQNCNVSFVEWLNDDEIICNSWNGNTNESYFYRVTL